MDLRGRFGLNTTPFTRELPVRHRFPHDQFDAVLADLRDALHHRMSVAVIAPAGTGKTALVRALRDDLPEARYRVHYVKVASLSKRDMCREITAALGVRSAGSTPGMIRNIQAFVRGASQTDGQRAVLIFDDAHEMRPEVLGLLKTLTNYAMDSNLLLWTAPGPGGGVAPAAGPTCVRVLDPATPGAGAPERGLHSFVPRRGNAPRHAGTRHRNPGTAAGDVLASGHATAGASGRATQHSATSGGAASRSGPGPWSPCTGRGVRSASSAQVVAGPPRHPRRSST